MRVGTPQGGGTENEAERSTGFCCCCHRRRCQHFSSLLCGRLCVYLSISFVGSGLPSQLGNSKAGSCTSGAAWHPSPTTQHHSPLPFRYTHAHARTHATRRGVSPRFCPIPILSHPRGALAASRESHGRRKPPRPTNKPPGPAVCMYSDDGRGRRGRCREREADEADVLNGYALMISRRVGGVSISRGGFGIRRAVGGFEI